MLQTKIKFDLERILMMSYLKYINKPTKKLTKYRIDFEGKRVCEYYSESIGNGTALDY